MMDIKLNKQSQKEFDLALINEIVPDTGYPIWTKKDQLVENYPDDRFAVFASFADGSAMAEECEREMLKEQRYEIRGVCLDKRA